MPSILDDVMKANGWDPDDDPGSLCKPFPKKREPICHCPVPQKHRLGGMRPRMDLKSMQCRCAVCQASTALCLSMRRELEGEVESSCSSELRPIGHELTECQP